MASASVCKAKASASSPRNGWLDTPPRPAMATIIHAYGRAATGKLVSLYLGDDADAAHAAAEKAGTAGKIEHAYITRDAEPYWRHTYDAAEFAARQGRADRAAEDARRARLTAQQREAEAAAKARAEAEAEIDRRKAELAAAEAALPPAPAAPSAPEPAADDTGEPSETDDEPGEDETADDGETFLKGK